MNSFRAISRRAISSAARDSRLRPHPARVVISMNRITVFICYLFGANAVRRCNVNFERGGTFWFSSLGRVDRHVREFELAFSAEFPEWRVLEPVFREQIA